jgi:protocatechuate 3,4-dioxygenase beta subunit
MLITGSIKDTKGRPIEGVKIDIWETDETGHYDAQYDDYNNHPDCRGIIHTDKDGQFRLRGIRPVSYPIPHDGPVGRFLKHVGRHPYRPAHLHFKINKEGFDELITAFYMKGDPYLYSDAVFGVKSDLIADLQKIADEKLAKEHEVQTGDWHFHYDFVLITNEESKELFIEKSKEALNKINVNARLVDGLPVSD